VLRSYYFGVFYPVVLAVVTNSTLHRETQPLLVRNCLHINFSSELHVWELVSLRYNCFENVKI